MDLYKIVIADSVYKDIKKVSPPYPKKIIDKIETLRMNPKPTDVKKLKGSKNAYRSRVADYRILFELDEIKKVVNIYRVKHRKDSYK